MDAQLEHCLCELDGTVPASIVKVKEENKVGRAPCVTSKFLHCVQSPQLMSLCC
jgi:hypothetical protein